LGGELLSGAYDMASSGVVKRIAADIARFHAELELDGAA
jgi:hypothetical protein